MSVLTSTSLSHFIDTNVLLRHANNDSTPDSQDIQRILDEAADGKRSLWISSVIFAEFRPSSFRPGKFDDLSSFVRYIQSITETISPTPETMLRAGRLRDIKWWKSPDMRQANEKVRCLTLGDAVHLASALWVKEALGINDIEFLTFDNGQSTSDEADSNTKALSLLSLQDYTYDIGGNPDVRALVELRRIRPVLADPRLPDLHVSRG